MKIYVKNMVCNRCISAVSEIFNHAKLSVNFIQLGEVEIEDDIDLNALQTIENLLISQGFERLKTTSQQLHEKIKSLIITKIERLDIEENFLLSEYLSNYLHKDYSALSKSFSQAENTTLEHYYILQKIEKVKELLLYNEFTLTEIADKLGYKSVQYLSAQFKNCTGLTPTNFKKLKSFNRKPLDEI